MGAKKVSEVFIHELGELRMRFLFGVTRHSAFVRISINKAITEALENLITAIDQADVSDEEKKEAKSLLRKLLGSKAAANVLGRGAQSLAAKYFTG